MTPNYQKFTFKGGAGAELAGRIDLPPDSSPRAYAQFAHCFTCTHNFKAIAHIVRALTQAEIAVFRFDFTGLGDSRGDFANTSFSTNVHDLEAAARFLETEYESPRLLIGHSFGGTASLKAAQSIDSVRAVVTIGSPSDPRHVKQHLDRHIEQIKQHGKAEIMLAGRPFTFKQQFLDDLQTVDMPRVLKNLRKPLLIMHAPADDTVNIEHAGKIFQAARHPKSFISLDRADHLLSRSEDARYAGGLIAAWAERYISQ